MIKFTRTGIFCVSILIMFILTQIIINQYVIETEINEEIMNTEILEEIKATEKAEIWQLEIPKIELKANILEGTTKEVLKQQIGHFANTSKEKGNIGLAASNRGNEVSYFKDLKRLQKGDEIKYKYNNYEKIYVVEKNRIIRDTEWEFLEETEENMLTLITYIENQPQYRRCVQAVEKEVIA